MWRKNYSGFSVLLLLTLAALILLLCSDTPSAVQSAVIYLSDLETSRAAKVDQLPRFAFALYATNAAYLCNALIIFRQLQAVNTTAELVLIYPESWDWEYHPLKSRHPIRRMLRKANRRYGVKFYPRPRWTIDKARDKTWEDSLNKLYVLGMEEYTRLIYVDSDGLVLKNMDHLFELPEVDLALPRAYWTDDNELLATHMMVVSPSKALFKKAEDWVAEVHAYGEDYDMDAINNISKNGTTVLVLPHRRYAMLSGEFRRKNHRKYMAGEKNTTWDAVHERESSYYIHFSDFPMPKPWEYAPQRVINKVQPSCPVENQTCPDREEWQGLHDLYHSLQEQVC